MNDFLALIFHLKNITRDMFLNTSKLTIVDYMKYNIKTLLFGKNNGSLITRSCS